jgi:hypothetical protein
MRSLGAVFKPLPRLLPKPFPKEMTMKHISRSRKQLYLPELFEWAAKRDICVSDYRIRWVAGRCRVSRATAETIIANAGFANVERR